METTVTIKTKLNVGDLVIKKHDWDNGFEIGRVRNIRVGLNLFEIDGSAGYSVIQYLIEFPNGMTSVEAERLIESLGTKFFLSKEELFDFYFKIKNK